MLSSLVLLADGLLSLSSEYGCEAFGEVVDGEARVYYGDCTIGEEVFELGELGETGVEVRYVRGTGGKPPEDLLEDAMSYALRVLSELKQYKHLTRYSEVEYVLLVTKSGDIYVAEGEVGRVSLPYLSGVVLEAHTHPYSCLPSERDVSTALARFMEGLYATAVVGLECAVIAYRSGPLTEEDLVTFRKLPTVLANTVLIPSEVRLGSIRVAVLPY